MDPTVMSQGRDELDGNGMSGAASLLDLVPSLEHSITGLIAEHGKVFLGARIPPHRKHTT